ncbi:MAG TPA: hypothetical protein VM555_05205, partial [Tahibacter sp.]|nr:hypothetical protein [Tahibacter sp.]
ADALSSTLADVSAAFADAANGANGLDRITFSLLEQQRQQAMETIERLKQQNAAYDETYQRVLALRQQFPLLGDDALRAIAEQERALRDNQQRAQEQSNRNREQQQTTTNGGGGGTGNTTSNVSQTFNVNLSGSQLPSAMDADTWYRKVFIPAARKAKLLGIVV